MSDVRPTELLLVDDADGVRTITINRPEVKNALTAAMRTRFSELDRGRPTPTTGTRAIIVTAVDPVFSAGVDFKEVAAGTGVGSRPPTRGPRCGPRRRPWCARSTARASPGRWRSRSSCTFIVASERARFADTHARLDVVAAWGLTALLPRAVGVRKAAELSITGNFVDAAEALRLGLVNHVVPHDELLPFTRALVRRHRTDRRPWPRCSTSTAEVTGCPLADALALEAAHAAGRRVDPAAFGAAGAAAAARGKP